ncbi:LysR family transcriptional regulator [Streptomyces sp. SID10815]|uniref:LysR substrate-binding domain-containing protein n=1 Tax=Streptomyces sp. SID10815 TaxID=2706027 RepID=UPI0013CC7EDB|nr:LysR family transcriptional regulator [Streptomyces sp. SID10815]
MDTRHLEAFLGAVDAGSVTRAASVLQVTQPTVTNRIKALERSLGLTLLERLPDGVRPTSAGRSILEQAREIVRLSGRVRRIADASLAPQGKIRVGASESLINHRLLPLIEYLLLRYPDMDVSLRLSTPQEALAMLRNGQLDCVFMIGSGAPREDLDHCDLCPEPFALVAGRRRNPVRPGAEETVSSILVTADLDVRHCGRLLTEVESTLRARRTLKLDSITAVKRMAESGLGVGLLPEVTVAEDIAAGRLRRVVDWRPATRTCTQALWRRDDGGHPVLDAVLKAASDVVGAG